MGKGVADLVLLTNEFLTVPSAIGEGRRILRNTHRVARLFVVKSVYSAFLLALAASGGAVRGGDFVRAVARFALPIGAVSAAVISAAYLLARGPLERTLVEAGTVATGVTVIMGLVIVMAVELVDSPGRVRPWVWGIVVGPAAVATGGLSVSWLRSFFELARPGLVDWLAIAGAGMAGGCLVSVVRRSSWKGSEMG